MFYCGACGTRIDNNEKLCDNCGRQQQAEVTASTHRQGPARKQRTWPIVLISVALVTGLAALTLAFLRSDPVIAVPGEHATIQAAIDAAKNGDVIVVSMGTYPENINFRGKAIIVRSSAPDNPVVVAATIIHGLNLGSVVTFASGEPAEAVLTGFTITGGSGSWIEFQVASGGAQLVVADYFGGGILVSKGSSPTIAGNVITGNSAGSGGGIAVVHGSSPRITGNTISNNASGKGGGGGIYIGQNSSPAIEKNAITGNTAYNAGANTPVVAGPPVTMIGVNVNWRMIRRQMMEGQPEEPVYYGSGILIADGSSPTVTGNAIVDNVAGGRGGGIAVVGDSAPTITHNTIADNTAWWGGGVYSAYGSAPAIEQNSINGNTAHTGGGGIAVIKNSSPTITSNTITGNTAASWGGGFFIDEESSPTIEDNSITGNAAEHGGGGMAIFSFSSPAVARNTIADNTAYMGGAIWVGRESTLRISTPDNNTYRNNIPDNIDYEVRR